MSAMDKLLGFMGIDRPEEDVYEDGPEEDDGYVENPPKEKFEMPSIQDTVQPETKVRQFERKTGQTAKKRTNVMNDVAIRVFKPVAYDEAREIVMTLMENKIVVLNFENVEISTSQRVLDIVTGACIAIDGNLQKMSDFIFIAAPHNVDISGAFQDSLTGTMAF